MEPPLFYPRDLGIDIRDRREGLVHVVVDNVTTRYVFFSPLQVLTLDEEREPALTQIEREVEKKGEREMKTNNEKELGEIRTRRRRKGKKNYRQNERSQKRVLPIYLIF